MNPLSISLINIDAKVISKILTNQTQQYVKKDNISWPSEVFQECEVGLTSEINEHRRILGRWQSRKHQKSVTSPRQWQNLCVATIVEHWSIGWKGLPLTGKVFDGKLQLVSVNFSSWHNSSCPFPTPPTPGRQPFFSWSHLHTVCRSQGGQKEPSPLNVR